MNKMILLVCYLLSCCSGEAQKNDNEFINNVKLSFKKSALSKNNNLILLSGYPYKQRTDTAQYFGEFPIKGIKVFDRRDAIKVLGLLTDSSNYIFGNAQKSCAFVPTHIFLLSNNKKKVIAYSGACEQFAILSLNLEKLESISNVNDTGRKRFEELLSTLSNAETGNVDKDNVSKKH